MTSWFKTLLAVAIGAIVGSVGYSWFAEPGMHDAEAADGAREPLYWVAPMDSNYRRDKPGKSPMGMDLIPVFEAVGATRERGAVEIAPQVVNNLGVRTDAVKKGNLRMSVETVGYVQYDEDRLVHISPRVEGWLETLHVTTDGDPVSQGEPLYTLYSPTLVNAQEELLLALKRDNSVLIQAAENRLSALEVPPASIQRLRDTRTVSQTITVAAPQSGFVDKLTMREGMYVQPGSMLMSIGQLEHLWVIGEVFARQAGLISVGDEVAMHFDSLPGQALAGQVDYIYPTLNEQTRTVQVRVRVKNPEGLLKPGMFARLTIDATPGAPSLLIPREALIRTGGHPRVVLDLGEGQFKSIAVTVGRIGEQQVEIRAGLEEGEQIVTSAQFLIDSESSKTSDFQRMSPPGGERMAPDHRMHDGMNHGSMSPPAPEAGNEQDSQIHGTHVDKGHSDD